jgi:chemotaxis protein methyltransferase CheR
LRKELQSQSGFDEIVGESNSLLYVLTRVKQVAETDATVLIQGETGVGKELVARAIHQSSRRAEKPFIKPITVPPLRSRLEDIPLLVQYFVTQIASRMGKKVDQVPPHVMVRLQEYDWPGNVRELRNVLEQAVIHSPDRILQLPKGFAASPSRAAPTNPPNGFESLETVEKEHILKALEATGWRISGPKGAATVLGINPSTLRFRMKKLGIRKNH